MVNYTPPTSDIIELKNEIKKLKEQLESETLAKNEGAEIVAELAIENERLKSKIHFLETSFDFDCGRLEEEKQIAVKCLKEYANPANWYTTEEGEKCFFCVNGYSEAEEALKKINGVI